MAISAIIFAKRKIISDGYFNDYFNTDYNFDRFDNILVIEAQANGIDPKMLKAIGMNESLMGYVDKLETIGNTQNVMHVTDSTARRFGITREQMIDPKYSIKASAKYLAFLKKEFNGNQDHIVMAYNGGEGRMRQIIAGQHKTDGRINKAFENMQDYKERYYRNLKRLG